MKKPLIERAKNVYWGYDVAPIECQYKIKCRHFNRTQFRDFLKQLMSDKDCIYYSHNTEERTVTLAFESKQMRDEHAVFLEAMASSDEGIVYTVKK